MDCRSCSVSTLWGKVDQWRGRATVQSQLQVPKAERQWSGDSRDREGSKPLPEGERDACSKGHCTHTHTLTILYCSLLAYQLEDIVFCTLSRHIGNTFCHSFVVSTATNARASPFKQASLRGQSPTQNCTGCSTCVGDRRSLAHTRSS